MLGGPAGPAQLRLRLAAQRVERSSSGTKRGKRRSALDLHTQTLFLENVNARLVVGLQRIDRRDTSRFVLERRGG